MSKTTGFHHYVSATATAFAQTPFASYVASTGSGRTVATVSLRPLENSPQGWSIAKALFDKSPSTAAEFFGPHNGNPMEGRMFFDRVFADCHASRIEIFEIVSQTGSAESAGIVTLGTGYAGNTGAYIHFMFVVDSMRDLGIGSRALQLLEARAALTSNSVSLLCPLPESQSARFWRKNGYRPVGRSDGETTAIDGVMVAIFRKNLAQATTV